MIQPSFPEFKKLAKKGNLVALRQDLPSDLETPVSAFLKLAHKEACTFLLESAEQEERIGRYSFLGFDPEMILTLRDQDVYLEKSKRTVLLQRDGDLLEILKKYLQGLRLSNPEGLPNFAGGFVGFLGYENVRSFEQVELRVKRSLDVEEGVFFLAKNFILFDHFKKNLSLISLCELKDRKKATLKKSYAHGRQWIKETSKRLERSLPKKKPGRHSQSGEFCEASMTRREFEKGVGRIKEYIRAGDCIQVVFSQRFFLGRVRNDFEIYRSLRSINPSPYMFYFRYKNLRLIGSSPELLVKKNGNTAEVCPIAGTRKRGASPAEDSRLEENLRRSVKENAEHLMLVDLGRNDLGRVCRFNSISVSDFARVDRYSHVMHLVSSVKGKLKSGKDAFDLLRATFPAGTVTGAPKIRAMQIIDELEKEKRGPYAGSLGYYSLNGDMDMCITIRTIVVHNGKAYVQAGAGVVYDSKPKQEYEETMNKAKALFQAVRENHAR